MNAEVFSFEEQSTFSERPFWLLSQKIADIKIKIFKSHPNITFIRNKLKQSHISLSLKNTDIMPYFISKDIPLAIIQLTLNL